ncbi:MAG: hypothetical protein H6843_05100 [Rhodospirillaceae bacterium]|nr:hypothetical protein [Rhodospirillaceae bacterium]
MSHAQKSIDPERGQALTGPDDPDRLNDQQNIRTSSSLQRVRAWIERRLCRRARLAWLRQVSESPS